MNLKEIFPQGDKVQIAQLAYSLDQSSPYFEVLQIIEGGMGGCIKIKAENGKCYALKIILPEKFESETSLRRYIVELRRWRTYSMCNGVLQALLIIKHNDIPCVISPWLDRGELSTLMQSKERTVFYNAMHRIVGTLKWVYDSYHVIHRDLKPSNILVDKDYLPYIADWGLSKSILTDDETTQSVKDNLSARLTNDGWAMGTPTFMSPEQLTGARTIDFRSDIFALGIIMYLWETGSHPFAGKTINDIQQNIFAGKFKKLGGFFSSSNFGADRIINKCLAHNPNDRYSSYSELLKDIEYSAKDVPMFTPYRPQSLGYSDLVNPANFADWIKREDVNANIGKDINFVLEQDKLEEFITIASELGDLGEVDKAVEMLKSFMPPKDLIQKFPDIPFHQRHLINLSWFVFKQGKIQEAIDLLGLISHGEYLCSDYYVNLSDYYLCSEKFDKCIDISKRGLAKYPDDSGLIGNYAQALIYTGEFQEASHYCTKRIKIDPSLTSFYESGLLCYKWGDSLKETDFPNAIKLYKSAVLYYRKALSYNPKHFAANHNLSIVLFKLKRYKDSAEILKTLGRSEAVICWLAKNFLWWAEADVCLKFCSDWLKVYPESIMLKRVHAECMVDNYVYGKTDKDGRRFQEKSSWGFYESMINDEDNRVESDLRYYGKLLAWLVSFEEASRYYDWAKSIFPNEWTLYFYNAYNYLNLGKPNEALEQALIANRKAPWREYGLKCIADCYNMLGKTKERDKYMAKFQSLKKQKAELYASCASI